MGHNSAASWGKCFFLEPNAPSNVGVTTVAEDLKSLTVTWTASTTADVSYTVSLKKGDTPVKTETDVSGQTKTIDGLTLTAWTQYTVVVVAVIGGESSSGADKTFYTSKSEGDCISWELYSWMQ